MEIIFEWDAKKARVNLEKHRIDFDEAQTVFNDPHSLLLFLMNIIPKPKNVL